MSLKKTLPLIALMLAIIMLSSQALALGIAPSRKVVDYQPNKKITVQVRIINEEEQAMRVVLTPSGDLADHVSLSSSVLTFSAGEREKTFTYTLEMPPDLSPGRKKLRIAAVELPRSFEVQQEDNIVLAATAVVHSLIVNVPYPGLYAEGGVRTTQSGSTVTFTVGVFNKGVETFKASADLIVKGPTNQELARLKTNEITLESNQEGKLVASWQAPNPGQYFVEVILHYNGKFLKFSRVFEVTGEELRVKNIQVKSFKLGGVARFDISVESLLNHELQRVYADVNVMDKGVTIAKLTTAPVDIPAFGSALLQAFWDTSGVSTGSYDLEVTVHFNDKTLSQVFKTVVGIDELIVSEFTPTGKAVQKSNNSKITILIALVIVLVIINIAWLFVMLKKKR